MSRVTLVLGTVIRWLGTGSLLGTDQVECGTPGDFDHQEVPCMLLYSSERLAEGLLVLGWTLYSQ